MGVMNRQDAKHAKNAKEVAAERRVRRYLLNFVLIMAWRPWRLGGQFSGQQHIIVPIPTIDSD